MTNDRAPVGSGGDPRPDPCDACKGGRHDDCVDADLSFHDIADAIPPSCGCDEGDCAAAVSMACDIGFHNCPGCPCPCHDDPKVREVWREAHSRYVVRLPISSLAQSPPEPDDGATWRVEDDGTIWLDGRNVGIVGTRHGLGYLADAATALAVPERQPDDPPLLDALVGLHERLTAERHAVDWQAGDEPEEDAYRRGEVHAYGAAMSHLMALVRVAGLRRSAERQPDDTTARLPEVGTTVLVPCEVERLYDDWDLPSVRLIAPDNSGFVVPWAALAAAGEADLPRRSRADAYLRAVATLGRHGVDCPPGSPLAVDLRDAIGRVAAGDAGRDEPRRCGADTPAGRVRGCPACDAAASVGGGGEPVGNQEGNA